MESKIGEANAKIFVFGWCKNIIMGISPDYILFFKNQFSFYILDFHP